MARARRWTAGALLAALALAQTGCTFFALDGGEHVVSYAPWKWTRVGLAVSLLTLAGLVALGIREHADEWRGRWR